MWSDLDSSDERDLRDDGLEDDPEQPAEAEVHDLGLDLAHAELDVAVGGEHQVHVHDDLVAAHVLVVHLDAGDPEVKFILHFVPQPANMEGEKIYILNRSIP